MDKEKARVTGIGGIFFKSADPSASKDWYHENLGIEIDQWGTNFEWHQGRDASKKGFTQWSPAARDAAHFDAEYMINYRVVQIEKLVQELKQKGVTIVDELQSFPYGKFVHVLDNEGRKVELWEPNDEAYDKIVEARTK